VGAKLYKCTVYFEVVQLRRHGQKLPPDQLGERVRGHVVIKRKTFVGMHSGPEVIATAYLQVESPPPYPGHSYFTALTGVQIIRMDERGMVIVGEELLLEGGVARYRQAWACKPVG
jgi:hypothetical protein